MREKRPLLIGKTMNPLLALAMVAGSVLSVPVLAEQTALSEAGKRHFGFRCAACHSLSADAPPMFGPHLEGIVDRTAGMVEGFEYTDPKLRAQGVIWDEEYFEEWLQHPQQEYPEMCLPFRGLADPGARRALFVFLRNPVP